MVSISPELQALSDDRLSGRRQIHGDRHVTLNADGTVAMRLSSDTKGKADDPTFLPVPNKDFHLLLRMYGGDEEIQVGRFPAPVVRKI